MQRVGIDIGGTFTDLVGLRDGAIVIDKKSNTPHDPTEGVAAALASVETDIPAISDFLHGTTIAINTVLERKGANTALITTKGFRDVYSMGRNNRPEAFNLEFRRPRPLVPRSLTWEVSARMMASGEIIAPLIDAEIETIGGDIPMRIHSTRSESATFLAGLAPVFLSRSRTISFANTGNTNGPPRRR
jgi:N-methylhydantoinase A